MKKAKWIILVLLTLLIIGCCFFAMNKLESPEYALLAIQKDMAENGMEGLKQHLTGDAQQLVERVEEVSNSGLVGSLAFGLGLNEFMEVIKEEFRSIEWELIDLLKGDDTAIAVLGYNYKDSLSGRIELTLVKQEKSWMVDKIGLPSVEVIDF